jgi:hypothetical protein
MQVMTPFREKKKALEADRTEVERLRKVGATRAREIAAVSLARVREAVGV